jgi:very-short-patch-repair endonuclease
MVATPQMLDAGLTREEIKHRVRTGRLHRRHRGVYAVGHLALPPLADEAAALLAVGPGAVLSHRTALAMWGLFAKDPATVDVLSPTQRRTRPGIRVHQTRRLPAEDVRTREGLPVTCPYRSILDLRPLMSDRQTQHAVSEALVQRLITDAEAETLVDKPRITRSEAERIFLRLVRRAGLPEPLANTKVGGYEADFHWPRHALVVEIDGFRFHGHRVAFEDDRRKDLALTRAGVRVIRLSWRQLADEPELVVASLARLVGPA